MAPCSVRTRAAVTSAIANLTVQYNLNSATIAIPFLLSTRTLTEPPWAAAALKGAAFVGAFVGMIVVGLLGDRLGPRTGLLATVTVVLVGVAGAAAAPFLTRVWEALIASRFIVGVGVGGIYPMSAAIAAEAGAGEAIAAEAGDGEAITDKAGDEAGDEAGAGEAGDAPDNDERAGAVRAAAAFFWQSLGSPLPYVLAMLLLAAPGGASAHAQRAAQAATLLGLGAVPAALVFALTLSMARRAAPTGAAKGASAAAPEPSFFAVVRERPDLLVALVGTAGCWFLFDVSAYGISVFAPEILLSIFGAGETLMALCWQTTVVSLIGVPACALAVVALPRLGSRALMAWGFAANALCFLCLGAACAAFPGGGSAAGLKFALFCAASFSLSWGPNVATFVAPVDAFPAAFRGTFHGLSAASGKAGAVLGAFLFPVVVAAIGAQTGTAAVVFVQVAINAAGAAVAWRFLPVAGRVERACGEYTLL